MKFHSFVSRQALCVQAFALSALLTVPGPLSAQSAEASQAREIAERFSQRSSILNISLSPSGTKVAWISAGPEHSELLNVVDLTGDGEAKLIVTNTEIVTDLTRCDWASDTRLVCQMYGMLERSDGVLLPFTRMFAVDEDGKETERLSEDGNARSLGFNQFGGNIVALEVDGETDTILMTRDYVPESTMLTRVASRKEGLGVDLVNIENGRRSIVEQPDDEAGLYLADSDGRVRVKLRQLDNGDGVLTGEERLMYRVKGDNDWERLQDVRLGGAVIEDFDPIGVDSDRDVLFAFHRIDGYVALIAVALDGSATAEVIASREGVDVDGVVRIGRQRRIVGVTYATEKRSVEYFDSEIASLSSALGKALPNTPLIDIVGASSDENRLLVLASSDDDPGMTYLYDKQARSLEELLPVRAALVEVPMGEMRPVSYPARDGTQIPAYLTLPPGSDGKDLPSIVLPHGGPASRDYWGFDWLVQYFVARGYAVLQPNFRGSSGFGEQWFGRNGYQAWDVAIGDVNDAGRWMIGQGIAAAEKLAIVGWSYGGYAALQSQVVEPDLYKAVVAIAPVTDLEYLRSDARAYTSFRLRDRQLGQGPHISAGSPRQHAEQFKAPVALFHGSRDLNVTVRHSRDMAKALRDEGRQVTYVEFEDLQHDLDDSKARLEMLETIDGVLTGAMGS